jgi:hypothetical protein
MLSGRNFIIRRVVNMKKLLVVGIIILFISVSCAPSINANIDRTTVKSKLVETAIRIHRANGISLSTVKLTEKGSDEVDRIFDNLKASLDSAETGEEIDAIYDGAVESLYELGLFPRMTIKEAKQLVKGDSKKTQSGSLGAGDENFNCQISGNVTSECTIFDVGELFMGGILFNLFLFFKRYLPSPPSSGDNLPFFVGRIGKISFGCLDRYNYMYFPSIGWVHTNGTNGVIKWEGEFFGNIGYINWGLYNTKAYVGVNEFNGLWTQKGRPYPCYFLGNAEHVSITYN